jgi:rubrerythrin
MNLDDFDLEDLIKTAYRSELDSEKTYSNIADNVENDLLKDKLMFLAKEEKNHQNFIKKIYNLRFPDKTLKPSKETVIPFPKIEFSDEDIPLSKILKQAMDAEKSAQKFYQKLSEKFDDKETKNMLQYFADMEKGHYKLLENEKESMKKFEQADVYWHMVHAGP